MKKFFEPRKKRCGSSIIEMLLAIFILSIVVVGLLCGVVIARNSLIVKEREAAQQIALTVLENLESRPFDEIEDRKDELEGEIDGFAVGIDLQPSGAMNIENADSVTVTVNVTKNGRRVTLNREVSASAWQNVGEVP